MDSIRAAFAWLIALRVPATVIALAFFTCAPGLSLAQAYKHKIAPNIGPYSYFASNCNANASNWTSTVEEAMQSVADNYHAPRNNCSWPITRVDPWATPQQPLRGVCASTHFYPKLFPSCSSEVSYDVVDGIECQNSFMFYTQYTARDSEGACTISGEIGFWAFRSRTVECPEGFVWDDTAKYCVRTDAKDDPFKHNEVDCPQCADSINAAQGFTIQSEVDVPASASPLKFERFYSSNRFLTGNAGLGRNWRHNWQRSLTINEGFGVKTVVTNRENHNRYSFTSFDQGVTWVNDPDVTIALTPIGSSSAPTGWKLALDDGKEETYNAAGQLISVVDVDGRTVTLQHQAGKLARVVDETGRALEFSYTGNYLTAVTTPGGLSIAYTYNANGMLDSAAYEAPGRATVSRHYAYENSSYTFFLTGITDENNNRIRSWQYNSFRTSRSIYGDLSSNINRHSVSYNLASGNVYQAFVTDPLGQQRTYTFSKYHGKRRVTSVTPICPSCGSISNGLSYNSQGLLEESRDFKNVKTRYAYNTRGLVTTKTEAYGLAKQRTFTTDWHPALRRVTREAIGSRETTYQYNSRAQLEVLTQRDTTLGTERSTVYSYYEAAEAPALVGLLKTSTAPGGAVTTYEYYDAIDPSGHFRPRDLKSVTNALGHRTEFLEYDGAGHAVRIQDPNGVETTLTYHPRGWLLSQSTAGETTSYEYRADGLMTRITAPDGNYIEYLYDPVGRLTGLRDGEGNRVEYTLDNASNRTAESSYDPTNALARTRTQVFNNLGQLWKLVGAAGTTSVTTTYAYDANGNQTGVNAPLGRNSVDAYDEFNRLKQTTDALSGVTQYGYNSLDQLTSVSDPRSKQTSYIYNALGDLTQQTSPDAGVTTNTYDSSGNLATSTDARSAVSTYTYDALNRVTSVTYADQVISYTYDTGTNQIGRLTQLTDNSGSTSWSFDTRGRVLSRQQTMGTVSKSVGYGYDAYGRLATLTLPSGSAITYGYANGKVVSLTLNGSTTLLSNVLYRPFGPTTGWTWGNSTLAVRDYDQDGKITLADSAGLKTYAYDDAFRITAITDATDPTLSQAYGYDLLDRLTSATGASLNQSWSYDANGNRLTQGGSHSSTYTVATASNRISAISGALTRTYGYDSAGNTTSDGSATYAYNDAGRMVSATKAGVTSSYALNGLGQRVRKTTGSASSYFVYDEAGRLIGEYDNSGNLIAETVWFGDIPVVVLKPNGSGGVNAFYIHTDHLNTPRKITRPSDSAIVWRWDSDPFGTTLVNENPSGLGAFSYGLRFPGQYYDSETGLHYNYYRDYDPATGRYVQSDPIGLEGGLNTYAYVSADPVSSADPLGMSERDVGKIHDVFNRAVDGMTKDGRRYINPYVNNFFSSFGASYLGCGDQESVVRYQFEKQGYDDQWTFRQERSLFHRWGVATSSNPSDPVITYDPWRNKIVFVYKPKDCQSCSNK